MLGIVLLVVAAAIALLLIGIFVKGLLYLLVIGAIILGLALLFSALRSFLGSRRRRSRR